MEPQVKIFDLPKAEELWVSAPSRVAIEGCASAAVRFAEVLDQMAWKRRERLVSIFGAVEFREISTLNLDGFAQHNEAFDVLICSVDDVGRLKAALRPPADYVVKKKISFAYCEKTSPGRRASLFRLGFDDVFYAGMSDEEIRLRFKSMINRYLMYTEMAKVNTDKQWEEFTSKYVEGALRGKQKNIVRILFEARINVVRYRDLASYDFALDEYNLASLKTTVSNIRKKLKGCDIVAVNGEGYTLVLHELTAA
jgi:hypothetical protein